MEMGLEGFKVCKYALKVRFDSVIDPLFVMLTIVLVKSLRFMSRPPIIAFVRRLISRCAAFCSTRLRDFPVNHRYLASRTKKTKRNTMNWKTRMRMRT